MGHRFILRRLFVICCLAGLLVTAGSRPVMASSDTAKVKVMILDGQMKYKGHKWYETTPSMKAMLEATGRFDVTVVTSPKRGQPNDDFQPNFAAYDVIVMNYEGDEWPEKTQKAFVDFVSQGGGVVSVHAADNGFPNWQAWNEMNGFGGWGGRNEKSGPMIWWEDGQIKRDYSPGKGGAHGKNSNWLVTVRDPQHPIMRGLPQKWMHFADELYSKMRGPGNNMHVLATGWQTPEERGTGRDEICLFTVNYGKGRIFRTTMGHDTKSLSCVGFIVTFQRGTEWAATGKVTLTDVPDDFPTEENVSYRKE